MALVAKGKDGEFELPHTGLVQAVCAFVIDIGSHKSTYQGQERVRHQVVLCFELQEKMTKGDRQGEPFMLSIFRTFSLNKKSTLSKDLESWFGKTLTDEQRKDGIDLEKLVGHNCMVNVIEKTKLDGEKTVGIAGIMPVPANTQIKLEVFNKIPPDWIFDMQSQSIEAKAASESMGNTTANDGVPF